MAFWIWCGRKVIICGLVRLKVHPFQIRSNFRFVGNKRVQHQKRLIIFTQAKPNPIDQVTHLALLQRTNQFASSMMG